MTTTCAVKRGFFVLRDCGEPAAVSCRTCNRPVCMEHRVALDPKNPLKKDLLCVECHARARNEGDEDDWDDATSPYRFRHRYYRTRAYSPFLDGYVDPSYDDYDFRAFDQEAAEAPGGGEEPAAGFSDS